jgi:DNA-binding NtrC family response regulator
LDKLLQQTAGNISRAATIAQKERRSFTRLMQKHGLKRSSFL